MLPSIFYILFVSFFFSNAQSMVPKVLITDQEERDTFSSFLASDVLEVQDRDQALYRDSGELLTFISNSSYSGGTNRIRFWQFRGVGESSQYENTPTQSITTLIDGVDVTGMLTHWPLLDVERVRVEKQPYSVLYGGNAIGGVVDTALNHSTEDTKIRATADSRWGHGADGSLPTGKHRLSMHYNNDAGFITNTLLDESGNSRRELYGSLTSDWLKNDRWTLQSSVLATHFKNRYDVWSLNNNNETSSDRPGRDDLNMVGGALTAKYRISTDMQLHYWASLVQAKSYYSYDADWSNNLFWNTVPGWNSNYDYFDEFLRHRTQWHNRMSLEWKDFIFSLHASEIREDSDTRGFKNGAQRSLVVGNFKQSSMAAHAIYKKSFLENAKWSISGRTDTVKTQYRDDKNLSEKWNAPDWALATQLDYGINSENLIFLSLRRGFKNPIINIDPDTPLVQRRVESESALHSELGHSFKNSSWDFSQSVFLRHGDNQQVRVSEQLILNDPSSYVYYYDNAAKTTYMGYEIQGQRVWSGGRSVRGSLGFLRAHFKDYVFDGQILTGREVAHAPKNTWALQWSEPVTNTWSVVGQAEGKSAFYYSNNHGKKNSAYALLHVSVRYSFLNHELDIGVRNIFDNKYGIRAFYFANEPPDFPEKLYQQFGAPQTFYVNYRLTLN